MKLLLVTLAFLSGCATNFVGKNCNSAYRDINGELEKTELAVCEKP